MTPFVFLHELFDCGVKLQAVGEHLRVEAPTGVLTEALKEKLQRDRQSLLAIISRPIDAQYYRDLYQERAAIKEYDGLLPREQAEREAFIEAYCEYMESHPPITPYAFRRLLDGQEGRMQ